VPHRGQLGHASTAGGVAVIVAIVTSHEKNWREHNRSLRHRRPIFVVLFSADDDECYSPNITMASRMYDTRA
jgi:hypothetical protein